MLSAPSSSRDASLSSKPSASSTPSASSAGGAAVAPFDSVLAGLKPAQSGSSSAATSAKAPTASKSAKAAKPAQGDSATETTGSTSAQTWPAQANWLNAPVAVTDDEAPLEGEAEQPDADAADDSIADLANSLVDASPVPLSEPVSRVPTQGKRVDSDEVNTAEVGDRRGFISPEPSPEGSQLPGAAHRDTHRASGSEIAKPQVAQHPNAYPVSPALRPEDPSADSEVVAAALEGLPMTGEPAVDAPGEDASPDGGDAFNEPKLPGRAPVREGGVVPPVIPQNDGPIDTAPFAARVDSALSDLEDADVPPIENIAQHVGKEVVTPALQALGIDPAKVDSTMEIVAADPSALTPDMTASQADAELTATSSSAFDRVLQVVDAARPGERSAVNVRLDFGDAGPLNVHITMRDGRVHTMFRCDSPELRDTLTDAWSRFIQKGDTAALPLAEPVMLPLRSSTSSQDGGRQQENFHQAQSDGHSGRQAGAREDARANGHGRPMRRQAASIIAPTASASARGDSSSRLSVLA